MLLIIGNSKNHSSRSQKMPSFDQYVARHGECGALDIIEKIERFEGIRSNTGISLEERWDMVMQDFSVPQRMAA